MAMHEPAPDHHRAERRKVHRRYAPKVKTGCGTCKIRRVKCDETKPFCNKCTSTRRKCDGYDSPKPLEAKSTSVACSENLRPSLVLDVSSSSLEKRTFDFFRSRTVPCVSGYFNDSLWDRMVLQVSHSEPAVRFAINALGAQHEESVLRRAARREGCAVTTDFRTNFPAMQYSKALVGLQDLLKKDQVPMNVVLICSLAFIHFEALRECFVAALLHTENAIRLLQSSTTFNAGSIESTLVRAMMRIDVQGAMYLGMRRPGLAFYTSSTDNTLPKSFQDLTHARDLINTWSCRMYHFMREEADEYKFREPGTAPLEVLAKAQELEATFVKLEQLLLDLMRRPSIRLTPKENHGLNMLRCRVKVDRILSACALYTEACLHDRYLEQYEEIVSICHSIASSDDADTRLFTVSLDEGLLYPLWFTAAHCRDSRIRRSALKILKRLPSGSNVWHVEAMTCSAEKCIELEETACGKESPRCEDIPEWMRVHSAGLDGLEVSAAKRDVTIYLRTRPNGIDGEWVEHRDKVHCQWSNASNPNSTQQWDISQSPYATGRYTSDGALPIPEAFAHGHTDGHVCTFKSDPGLRLWLQKTEPQKLKMIEEDLSPNFGTLEDYIGSSCL